MKNKDMAILDVTKFNQWLSFFLMLWITAQSTDLWWRWCYCCEPATKVLPQTGLERRHIPWSLVNPNLAAGGLTAGSQSPAFNRDRESRKHHPGVQKEVHK